jgi:hypothetical protein
VFRSFVWKELLKFLEASWSETPLVSVDNGNRTKQDRASNPEVGWLPIEATKILPPSPLNLLTKYCGSVESEQ